MKKYIAVLSVFLLPLFMSACGGSGGAASDPSVSAGCVKGAMDEGKSRKEAAELCKFGDVFVTACVKDAMAKDKNLARPKAETGCRQMALFGRVMSVNECVENRVKDGKTEDEARKVCKFNELLKECSDSTLKSEKEMTKEGAEQYCRKMFSISAGLERIGKKAENEDKGSGK